jgi:beta-lactamase regulating signal transducer with metallopeptidase domain/protocatechuate 3,4-dioxygenase beta subunit
MLASWSVPPGAVGGWESLLIAVSWQLAALAVLGWLCERALRLRQPRVRHALWWFVLAAPLLLAPGREVLQQRRAVLRVPVPAATARVILVEAPAPPTALHSPLSVPAASVSAPAPKPARRRLDLTDGLGLVWLVGCIGLVLRLVVGHRRARRLRARSTPVAGTAAGEMLSSLCAQAGVSGVTSLRASADLGSPVLYGWRHPVILLPQSWLSALSDGELRAMLAHEVAHVRRRDFLASSLQRVLEIPLFFHPGAWLASRRVALAREELCDAWALSVGTEAGAYARSLAAAAERARGVLAPVSLGVAESRFTLLRRVEAIMARDGLRRASRPVLITVALLGLVAAAAFAAVEVGGEVAGAPAASAAGPLPQNAGSEARRMEAELKTLATAVLMFVQDNGGQFPPATNIAELQEVLAPYLGSYQVPRDRIQYVLPAGVRVGAIETPAVTPMLIIDERPDFAVVAYADGEVQDVPKGEQFSPRRVIDFTVVMENGQPAAGATVKLVGGEGGGRTDQAGRLLGLEVRPLSDAALYVVSADGAEDALPSVMFMGPREAKRVQLHRHGGPADMVQLSGRVIDAAGVPVAGARLWMRGFIVMGDEQDTFVGRDIGKTDAQGRFSATVPRLTMGHGGFISGWRDPWTCQVIAHTPGYGIGWASADGSAKIEGMEIALSKPAGLRGHVMDAEGRLLPDVPVGVTEVTRPGRTGAAGVLQFREFVSAPAWASTRTDKQGRFSLTDLPADGSVKLDITTCGAGASHRANEMAPELGVIKLSEQRGELMVKLRRQPVIEGVLLTPERKPAEGVKVWLFGQMTDPSNATTDQTAFTDKSGHYELPMTVSGTWTVWVLDTKYFAVLLKDRKVDLGEHVTIPTTVLQRSASIRGRVLDARTGAPVAGVPVMCNAVGPSPIPVIPTTEVAATTSLDGSFEIGGPVGKVVLDYAEPPAGYTWNYRAERETVGGRRHVKVSGDPKKPSTRTVQVKSGQVVTGMDLFVAPEATVTGEVLGPDGSPWHNQGFERGGHVWGALDRTLVTSTVYPPLGGSLKPDGTFAMRSFFDGVPATLMVVDEQDGLGGAARITPEVGAANHVTIRMRPLARVVGRVLMPDGSPAAGAAISLSNRARVTTTGRDGRFGAARGVVGLPDTVRVWEPAPSRSPGGRVVLPKYLGESKQFEVQPGQQEVDVGDIILKPYHPEPPKP